MTVSRMCKAVATCKLGNAGAEKTEIVGAQRILTEGAERNARLANSLVRSRKLSRRESNLASRPGIQGVLVDGGKEM